jgi:hypothetical protein
LETAPVQADTTRWLRSSSSSAATEVARRLLAQGSAEFNVRAWLSAETTAWEALRWAAEAVDLEDRERGNAPPLPSRTALSQLNLAKTAIHEARDFAGKYGEVDGDAIARMTRSHVTDVLDHVPTEGLTDTDASDRYLDEARVALAAIASRSSEAAQTMDLLAAVYLGRAEPKTLPSATALCLRRAALQGQPGNANLATRLGMHLSDVGLLDEACWVLKHSLSIREDRQTSDTLASVLQRSGRAQDAAELIAKTRTPAANAASPGQSTPDRKPIGSGQPRIPEIVELSPADFAALSKPVIPASHRAQATGSAATSASATPSNVTTVASTRTTLTDSAEDSRGAESVTAANGSASDISEKPGAARRFFDLFRRGW